MNESINIIKSIISETQQLKDFQNIPLEIIVRIHITIIDKTEQWLAKVIPIESGNYLQFELYIKTEILEQLYSSDEAERMLGKSVILHELYHVKEFILTNRKIDLMPIYNIAKVDTHSLLLNLGYIQWTEYYAHFNSSKYYREPPVDIKEFAKLSHESIDIINGYINLNKECQMKECVFDLIKIFIEYTVKLSARYNQTHDQSYILSLQPIAEDITYVKHYEYIKEIISYMDHCYQTYPDWVSENKFLEIGKNLFSIVNSYGITYSTDDLSDNFIFVKGD